MSPHFLLPGRPAGQGRRISPAAVGLRPGQPPELFPLVEHARRGAAGPRRGRRPAAAGGAGGPGPADAPRRPRPRAGHGVRRQLARLPPVRGAQQRRPRPVPRVSPTSCGRRCSRSRSASSSTWSANDRPVLDFLDGKHTFVNAVLARHYGMPGAAADAGRVGAGRRRGPLRARRAAADGGVPDQERAGPAHQPGEARLLGRAAAAGREHPGAAAGRPRTARRRGQARRADPAQVLARHRADKSCAGCHERFDAIGLAFEGYGPVGEARARDLGGRPVDTRATFPGGGEGSGLDGLRATCEPRDARSSSTTSAASCWPTPSGGACSPRTTRRSTAMRTRLDADGGRFGAWSRRSSPARSS